MIDTFMSNSSQLLNLYITYVINIIYSAVAHYKCNKCNSHINQYRPKT